MAAKFDFIVFEDFISPSLKDRIIYELSSPKKKAKTLGRFSHNVDSVINSDLICFKGNTIDEEIKRTIEKSVTESIVLSFKHQEGKRMMTGEAFDYLLDESDTVLALMDDWLVIKPEYEGGERLYYILKKTSK